MHLAPRVFCACITSFLVKFYDLRRFLGRSIPNCCVIPSDDIPDRLDAIHGLLRELGDGTGRYPTVGFFCQHEMFCSAHDSTAIFR